MGARGSYGDCRRFRSLADLTSPQIVEKLPVCLGCPSSWQRSFVEDLLTSRSEARVVAP